MGVSNRFSRGFLLWIGAAAVAVGLASCGSESSSSGQGGNAGQGGTTPTTTAAAGNGGNGGAGGGSCPDIEQVPGDCKKNVCENGDVVAEPDDTDVPDDKNDCTFDSCSGGSVMNTPASEGFVCTQRGGKVCDGEGNCVECVVNEDCKAGEEVCSRANECVPASCRDGEKNGDETGKDCGGSCGPTCPPGEPCDGPEDCLHGVCKQNTCLVPSCGDGVQNGTETDVDCGGSCASGFNPKKCGPEQGCMVGADCVGDECSGTICVPNCADGVLNNGETGVDCGGPSCGPCGEGEPCTADGDCSSDHCVGQVCCDTACDGECEACTAATKESGAGDGVCGPALVGKPCGPAPTCEDGQQTAQDSCNAAGACADAGLMPCSPYTCDVSTCKTSCAGDEDCAAPATCAQNACKLPDGGACAVGADCTSGFCADGVCCDTACDTVCKACTAEKKGSGADGTCGDVLAGTDPDAECPGLPACGGGQCQLTAGSPCTDGSQCVSGNCVDDVCCNVPCNGVCQACSSVKKGGGTNGACGNIVANSDPDDECAAGSNCNGLGACALAPNGTACTDGGECSSGFCVDGRCCNTACTGTCQACSSEKKGSGVHGVCGAIASGTDPDDECTGATACAPGGCKLPSGEACTSGAQCITGFCADGVCCDAACNTTCKACVASKKGPGGGPDGTCGDIPVGTDPDDECGGPTTCTGAGACALLTQGAPCTISAECQSNFCVDGVCCDTACGNTCQACTQAKKGSGTNGTCGNIASPTDPDDECAGTATCNGNGACALGLNGAPCTLSSECNSGFCADGVCCNTACTATCNACSAVKKGQGADGTCGNVIVGTDPDSECPGPTSCSGGSSCALGTTGVACGANAECNSGFCVDGVCCTSVCSLPCQACTAAKKGTGTDGSCGSIGSGTDPDNECAGSQVCASGACKLPQGDACAAGTDCLSGFCVDGVCCNTSCASACTACTNAKKGSGPDGVCAAIAAGTDPDNECGGAANCGASGCALFTNGTACAAGVECTSGNCVDGVCCNSACTTTCQACTAAKKGTGTDGTCAAIVVSTDPDDECPGAGICNGASACKLPQGEACAAGTDCLSGFCADGVCCNNACTTTCQACTAAKKGTAPGTDGTCGPIPSGQDPDNECFGAFNCNGATACGLTGNGLACTQNAECQSNFCVDGVCCQTACDQPCQACTLAKKGSGANGTCGAIASGTDPDSECPGPQVCNASGACKGDLGNACVVGTECASGFCADGVCCNTACSGSSATCMACTAAKKGPGGGVDGVCGTIAMGTDPDSECFGAISCSGSNSCALLAIGQPCTNGAECVSPGACIDGVCCGSATCNNLCNACSAAKKGQGADGSCGPILSGQDPDDECAGVAACNGASLCKLPQGEACSVPSDCASGFCADGVCCNVACAGSGTTCQACSAAKKGPGGGPNGVCGNIAAGTDPDNECFGAISCSGSNSCASIATGQACTANGECVSGFCVDGVCCGTACNGFCQACSAAKKGQGADGTCASIISGLDPDDECPGVAFCNGASSPLCKLPLGEPCTVAGDCLSAQCVDGVCCDTSCTGACQACTAAKKGGGVNGTCGSISAGTDPDNECFGNISCSGSNSCAFLANGAPCTANGECALSNGNCVDGVCCNSACTGFCQACTAAKRFTGTDGQCGLIASGNDPDSECPGAQVCNGASTPLCKLPLGEACVANADCLSNFCADGVCCDTACNGSCLACTAAKKGSGTTGACGPIASGTDPDNECAGATTCNGVNGCAFFAQGAPCSVNGECAASGGNCVDGVCCNSACTTTCQACTSAKRNGAGPDGTCGAIPSGLDPDDECVGVTQCNGSSACTKLTTGTACTLGGECQTNNCVDGFCCNSACTATCNACSAAKRGTGANGVCGAVNAGLDPDEECPGATTCGGAAACGLFVNGTACTVDGECQSGSCADGFCCNDDCSGLCEACAGAKTGVSNGTCAPVVPGSDPDDECDDLTSSPNCGGALMCGP